MLDGPFSPTMAATWLAVAVLHGGWSSAGVRKFRAVVNYDTLWADPATTDATVTRDWLAEWLVATHDPSQRPSQQHGRSCCPSQHHFPGWSPFYAVPAPRYHRELVDPMEDHPSFMLELVSARWSPTHILSWMQSPTQQVTGLWDCLSRSSSMTFHVCPPSISPIGFKFLHQAYPVMQMLQ